MRSATPGVSVNAPIPSGGRMRPTCRADRGHTADEQLHPGREPSSAHVMFAHVTQAQTVSTFVGSGAALGGLRGVGETVDLTGVVVRLPSARGRLLTKRQLAGERGRSTRWVELRMREGLPVLPRRSPGEHARFDLEAVRAWLDGPWAF
jgi:hypothetical protein